MRRARLTAVAVGVCGVAAGVAAAPGSVAAGPAATGPAGFSVTALADVAVRPGVQHVGRAQASPPTTADCEKSYKISCTERSWRVPWEQGNRLMFAGRLAARVAQRNMICLLRLGPPGCLAYSP